MLYDGLRFWSQCFGVLVLVTVIRTPRVAAQDVSITGLSLFRCDAGGTVIVSESWNTLFPDPAWDVGLYEGPVIEDPGQFSPALWLNDPGDLSVDITLTPGEKRTFAFHVGRSDFPLQP